MSLIKQLWIAIALVTLLSFGGSLIVSTLAAKDYIEQQINVKNMDNATSLALSLSQIPKDPVTIELHIAAQFDTGHYRRIVLTDPNGKTLIERQNLDAVRHVPGWFVRLAEITPHPGVAQVQDGWHQFGTLTLESQSSYAYLTLWKGTLRILLWFIAGAIITGLIGTQVIRHITRPLDSVVRQAESIGNRHFITIPEPNTSEFRRLVHAMNALSERVKTMLTEETCRLEELRCQTQQDCLTGLFNREQFMKLIDSALERDDASASGLLAIVHVGHLAELNQRIGRAAADRFLIDLAGQIHRFAERSNEWFAGRLNGPDMAILAVDVDDAEALIHEIASTLHAWLDTQEHTAMLSLPIGASIYTQGSNRTILLACTDNALAMAEQDGPRALQIINAEPDIPVRTDQSEWRTIIEEALTRHGVRLSTLPVTTATGEPLHAEAPAYLHIDGKWHNAGYFMPWAARQHITGKIDLAVAQAALTRIETSGMDTSITLSPETLNDFSHCAAFIRLLRQHPAEARKLWIELSAHKALRRINEFRALCIALRPLGCRFGIKHLGTRLARIAELPAIGLDYVKVDAAIVRSIDTDTGNQNLLRGLCTLAHSIGLVVFADGICSGKEKETLFTLGIDGVVSNHIACDQQ